MLRVILFLALLTSVSAEVKTGTFQLSGFTEYSPIGHKEFAERMGWGTPNGDKFYKIEEQTFEAFVPDDYDKSKPYGLVVWINSGDNGKMNRKYQEIFKKNRMIWIGANKSGNNVDTRIRAQLAIDGRHNMMKLYNIDPNRVYVSGSSGGGKVACLSAFSFPELYSGGIFCIGVAHWINIPLKGNSFVPTKFKKAIPSDRMKMIAEKGRYACMTGDKDFNREHIKKTYDVLFSKTMNNCKYYQVPGLGHGAIPPDWYEKAILQLDEPLAAMAKAYLTKGQQLLKAKKYSEAVKQLQLAVASEVDGAQAELDKITTEIGKYTKQAEDLLKEDSFVKSYKLYKKIADTYGACAESATAKMKDFKEDKDLYSELVADDLLIKAIYYFGKKDKANFNKYAGALMKKHPDTKAAAKAKERWAKKK